VIEIRGVGKEYGKTWAVRGLNCTVPSGEVFALLGPNGAGKTTTIRMMTGLVRPTEGTVAIAGHEIMAEPLAAKSALGYVPDRSHLYELLTGREFMGFVAGVHGIGGAEADLRARHLLERLGIPDQADELIRAYSHGMRQRLLFAAALVHDPLVLVIDEPFVGLDPYGVRAIAALIRELADGGTAVFLATHSLHIAQDLCDRAGVIHHGRLAAVIGRDSFATRAGELERAFMEITR
jgi:ABC-2 type transport system ATP-binding protein